MKLKHFLPLSVLAVLALAACDGPVNSSGDTSSDSSSEEPVPTLADYVDELPTGVVAEPVAAIEAIAALLPAADGLVNRAVQEYHDYYSTGSSTPEEGDFAYEDYNVFDVKRYDNDVLTVSLVDQSMAPSWDAVNGYGEWPEEFSVDFTAEATLWGDASSLNYVYEEDGDPDNAYSFALSSSADAELLAAYLDTVGASGNILSGLSLADEAYDYYAPTYVANGFNYLETIASVEKVAAAGEVPEYVAVTYETHLGYYLSAELAWGPSYNGVYAERYYSFGSQFIIADGYVQYDLLDTGSMYQAVYEDSSAEPVTPAVAESPWMTSEEWATYVTGNANVALSGIGYGSFYTYYETQYTDVSNGDYVLANLPDLADYREGDASDAGIWINTELLLA